MDIKKVIDFCKKSHDFSVYDEGKTEQWLGDGRAFYMISNYDKLTPQLLTAMAGLKEKDIPLTSFHSSPFPSEYDTTENTDFEFPVTVADEHVIFDQERVPVITKRGARFIPYKYLEPMKDDDAELYERYTTDGVTYFVIRKGLFVQAVVFDDLSYTTPYMQNLFQKLAEGIEKAIDETSGWAFAGEQEETQ